MHHERAARLLALLSLPGVGPAAVWQAFAQHGSVEAVWRLAERTWPGSRRALRSALPANLAAVAQAEAAGLRVLTLQDGAFPGVLKHEHLPPPPVLFVRGVIPAQVQAPDLADLAAVGVVGTRAATQAGLAEARALGAALAAAGAVVVSGLALGIDGAAHRGALAAGRASSGAAPTVAVLGGAHDRLHPRSHARLAEEIVERGGAVLSEHPPGRNPQPYFFPQRNRIIAALSCVLVVVEAGERSGALDTVTHALRVGRDVLTIPARPSDRRRSGNLKLLREGAKMLVDLGDLAAQLSSVPGVSRALAEMAARGAAPSGSAVSPRPPSVHDQRGRSGASEPVGGAAASGHASPGLARPSAPGYGCRRVLALLARHGDQSFDGLLARLTRSGARSRPTPAELAGCLARLDVAGCLSRGEDGRYRAAATGFEDQGAVG